MRRLRLGVLLFSMAVPAALAAPDPPAASASPREAAARELFRAFGGMKTTEAGAEAMLTAVRANPQLAGYEDVFRTWYMQTMTKSGFEAKIIALYAETFTQQELEDLAAFYRSPLGQKALSKVPELMKRGSEIGVEAAKTNQPELERMLEERRQEIEGASKPDKSEARDKDKGRSVPAPPPSPTATPRRRS